MSKLVFTNGCFDILHKGHFKLLEYCKNQGSTVVVGLNSDKSVKQLKGDSRPFFKQHYSKYALECCRYVDRVIIFDEKTPYNLIKQLKPDIIVKGGDYRKEDVVGHDIAEVRIFNFVEGYSTSKVLKAQENNDV